MRTCTTCRLQSLRRDVRILTCAHDPFVNLSTFEPACYCSMSAPGGSSCACRVLHWLVMSGYWLSHVHAAQARAARQKAGLLAVDASGDASTAESASRTITPAQRTAILDGVHSLMRVSEEGMLTSRLLLGHTATLLACVFQLSVVVPLAEQHKVGRTTVRVTQVRLTSTLRNHSSSRTRMRVNSPVLRA